MPEYLWSCIDSAGKKNFQRVNAASVQEAKEALLAKGFTHLQLQTDDAYLTASRTTREGPRVSDVFTPQQQAEMMRKSDKSFLWIISQAIKNGGFLYAIPMAWLAYRRYRSFDWSWLDVAIIAAPVLLFGFFAFLSLNSYLYAKINEARQWHRWDDVLSLVYKIQVMGSCTGVKLPAHEIARQRAGAFAGKKQLAEALEEMQPYANGKIEPWLYYAHLAGIYELAHEKEKAIEANLKSIELAPANHGAGYIDLAFRLIRYRHDVTAAREALGQAEKMENPEVAKSFLSRTRGMIAIEEGNFAEAKTHLARALTESRPFEKAMLMYGNIALTKAYLCLAETGLGNFSEAKRYVREVEPFLVATEENELLTACRQGIKAA